MKRLTIASCAAALIVGVAVSQAQDLPEMPQPQQQHEWLGQLAGEWEAEFQMQMEPGQPPMKTKGTETVRKIGGFWILSEHKNEFAGQPFTGLLTLGYDADKEQFVGTWIDSMTGHLWTYEGSLDEAGKVLTLETEGPCPHRPGEMAKVREVLELKSKDHKVFTSSMQDENGDWTTMLTIEYRRKESQ